MAEDFGKLSPEQLNKLASVISEAKGLTNRQAEIIEKVIAGETDIGRIRISYLKEYFDIYSKNLDLIARKQSNLNDAFLVLDKQITESYKKGISNFESSTNTSSSNSEQNGSASEKNKSKEVKQYTTNEQLEKLNQTSESDVEALIKRFQKATSEIYEIEDRKKELEVERLRKQKEEVEKLTQNILDLEISRSQTTKDLDNQVAELRLSNLSRIVNAENEVQSQLNSLNAERIYSTSADGIEELAELRYREKELEEKKAEVQELQKLEEARVKYIAKREREEALKNNGELTKDHIKQIQKEAAEKLKEDKLNDKKRIDARQKLEKEKANKETIEQLQQDASNILGKGHTFAERKEAWYNFTHDELGDKLSKDKITGKVLSSALVSISNLATQLEKTIDSIGEYKGDIDTRLQGSSNKKSGGSYWNQLVKDMTRVGAINPFFKQETFAENIKTLVNQGISFDLEQRAFLMTIQNKIANTFDVADGTLLRLIRIQQEDSTAGRLGMESALNSFLNNMYETSEYLSQVADGVRSNLEEMQALMKGAEGTEVEYQVQKWLGSLYSVGMSQNAVSSISSTLGQIAAGEIEGLTSGGTGNLLIMAANEAGLSIADILTSGINASDTNKLLQSVVDYLAKLAEDSKNNNVVQQQLANVFGIRASDLKAATNLASQGSTSTIYGNSMTYSGMLGQLSSMAGSMISRTSMTEMMTNIWENGKYSLAGSMASSPVSYFIYKIAKMVDDTAGGIDLPFINILGSGVDLNTTVSDLMRVAAVGTGILGSLGSLVTGLGNSFSGRAMLNQLGISSGSGLNVTPRGSGSGLSISATGGITTSGSGYVGNASGSDVKNATIQEAKDSKKQQMIEAKEEADANEVNVLNNTVLKIYELLDEVAHGSDSFKVQVEGYGLTKSGSNKALSKALGGTDYLSDSASSGSSGSTSSSGGLSSGGVNSTGVSGHISLGGWTTTAS